MPTVTKSIGTSGRDYSTIAAWESDLSNLAVYNAGDDAVGECYNDSVFDESFTISDSGFVIGLIAIKLKAASGEKHDGTPGSGVKIKHTGTVSHEVPIWRVNYNKDTYGSHLVDIEDLEFADVTISTGVSVYGLDLGTDNTIMSRCLINNITHSFVGGVNLYIFSPSNRCRPIIQNTMLFNCGKTGTSGSVNGRVRAMFLVNSANSKVDNCTIHNIYDDDASANSYGAFNGVYRNTIITGCDEDFKQQSGSSSDYNLSSDATAFGANSVTSAVIANIYASTVQGSEDLHLKADSPALSVGLDLGSTNEVNKDIDGETRGSEWDIGADQCATCSAVAKKFRKFALSSGVLGGFSLEQR